MPDFKMLFFLFWLDFSIKPFNQLTSFTFFCKIKNTIENQCLFICFYSHSLELQAKLTFSIFVTVVFFVFDIAVFEVLLIFEVDEIFSVDFVPESFFVLIGESFLPLLFVFSCIFPTVPRNLAIFFFHIHKIS